MKLKQILTLLAFLLIFSGCTATQFDVDNKIKSRYDLNKEKLTDNYVLIEEDSQTNSIRFMLYIIPFSGWEKFTDEYIINKLLEENDADLATNVQVENWLFTTLSISYYEISVRADLWRKK